jgi:hypothetical protein
LNDTYDDADDDDNDALQSSWSHGKHACMMLTLHGTSLVTAWPALDLNTGAGGTGNTVLISPTVADITNSGTVGT